MKTSLKKNSAVLTPQKHKYCSSCLVPAVGHTSRFKNTNTNTYYYTSRRSIRAIFVQRKNINPLVVTITLNFCMLSLHNLTILFLCMSDIVHSHAKHVEKKRRVLRGNTMSCRHRSMVGSMANPPHHSLDYNPEEDICSEEDSDTADHSYLPPRCLLYLGMMM